MSQDYIEYFEKRQLPKVDSTPILHLEWYLAHKEKNPSTITEIIPEVESQIECDPISLHERNETTLEALGKTFGDLMSNPDPGLGRLVSTKCMFSCNVSLVYVGLEIGSI